MTIDECKININNKNTTIFWKEKFIKNIIEVIFPWATYATFTSLLFVFGCLICRTYPEWYRITPTTFDYSLPIVTFYIFPYIFSTIWWWIGPILVYWICGKKQFYNFLLTSYFVFLFAFVIHIVIPCSAETLNKYAMDHITDGNGNLIHNDLANRLLYKLYMTNPAWCAMPSMHMINTYLIFLAFRKDIISKKVYCKKENLKKISIAHHILFWYTLYFSIQVFLSTILIKQHFIIDPIISIIICELFFLPLQIKKKDNRNLLYIFFNSINVFFGFSSDVNLKYATNKNISFKKTFSQKKYSLFQAVGCTTSVILFLSVTCLNFLNLLLL